MKKRILAGLLTLCFLFTPLLTLAEDLTFSDALYANGEVAKEARVMFDYVPQEQETRADAPVVGCEAAYLADPVSGKVFYEKNAHEKRYPASTTKILTALLVLENCDVNETVTVSQRALALVPSGYAKAGLEAGETFSVYVLLQALLIPSANEAACALAEHVSGSVSAFADLCNERAKELGCETLHFVNPNGVHDANHYCSAFDLYLIAKECRKYDVFNEIVQMTEFTLPATQIHTKSDRTYPNTNEMLFRSSKYYLSCCTGMKTGHTTPAGECLVSAASQNDLDLICVVLGGSVKGGVNERFSDSKKLLEFVYDNYSRRLIADHTKPLAEIEVEDAVSDAPALDVIIQNDLYSVAPNEITPDQAACQIDVVKTIEAPVRLHQVLGTVTYHVDGLVYTTNLVAGHAVERKPFWLYNMLVIIAVLLIVLIVLIAVSIKNNRKKRRKRKKRTVTYRR